MQWKEMEFPILVDSANRIGVSAVPLLWALDESGVVQKARPDLDWFRGEFLDSEFEDSEFEDSEFEDSEFEETPSDDSVAHSESDTGTCVSHYLDRQFDEAISGWSAQAEGNQKNAECHFRLGCAYRSRFDSESRQVGDFQMAVKEWTLALELAPNNYIYRRRVQQYGPNMSKPYPFYDWVDAARQELTDRGESPRPLIAEPRGAELASPKKTFVNEPNTLEEPDPRGEITRDGIGSKKNLIESEVIVAPYPVNQGESARVSIILTPNKVQDVHWTNDAGPATLVVSPKEGFTVDIPIQNSSLPTDAASTNERRRFDFEILVPETASAKTHTIKAYVVYYVCEGESGECVFLRRDLSIEIPIKRVDPSRRK